MQVESARNPASSKRAAGLQVLAAGLGIGLVIAWGADRRSADATAAIVWQEPIAVKQPAPHSLRIASFNIHSGKGADNRLDLSRTGQELQDVDFAGLYEVRSAGWGSFPHQAAELGERLQMRSVFLGTEHRWWRDHIGNAVLTTVPVAGIQRVPLIGTRGKAYRQAVLVDLPLEDQIVHILMVHVDSERDRAQQLAAVIRLFLSLQSPAVLMGDLNTRRTDPQLAALLSRGDVESVIHVQLGDTTATNTIDWLITRGLESVSAVYSDNGASDHPIVKAELKLRTAH